MEEQRGLGRRWGTALLALVGSTPTRLALIPIFGAALVPAGIVATGAPGSAVIAAVLADPATLLAARSPGGRPEGALTQSKPVKPAAMLERVLSDLHERPGAVTPAAVAPALAGAPADSDVLPGTVVAPEAFPVVASDVGPAPGPFIGGGSNLPGAIVTPGIFTPPGGGGTPGTGGGGGGGDTPGTVTPVTPGTPVASVPEPATWLTMIAGFGLIGAILRSRRRKAAGYQGQVRGPAQG